MDGWSIPDITSTTSKIYIES